MNCTRIDGWHMQMLSNTLQFLAYFRHILVAFEIERNRKRERGASTNQLEDRMELLSVGPQILTFYAPYDDRQRRMVTLLNPNDRHVLFKVR